MAKNKKKRKGLRTRNLWPRTKRGLQGVGTNIVESNLRSGKYYTAPYGSNYLDRVPWNTDSVQTNATFEGRTGGSMMRYFSAPAGIQVAATPDATDNQIPLMDMVKSFAEELDAQDASDPDKSLKRRFHIQLTRRDMKSGVQYPEGTAAEQADYLDRCCQNRPLASYALNMGVGLIMTGTSSDQFNGRDVMKSAVQRSVYRTESIRAEELSRYNQDSRRVADTMISSGFRPINFNAKNGAQKYHDITSWMCSDDQLLESSNIGVPMFGTSMITSRYGELAVYVVTMKDKNRQHGAFYSPESYDMQYAREFYRPENRVVHASMHGEIMSMKHTQMETELTEDTTDLQGREELSGDDVRRSQFKRVSERLDNATIASETSRYHPFIDNQFTVLCVRAVPGEEPAIVSELRRRYDMQVVPVNGAIIDALHATLPGHNKPIFTNGKKHWWNGRAKRANQRVFDGMVFLNGIFNTFSPPVKEGIFGGLTNSFLEFRPWFLNPKQTASKTPGENSPGVIITGRPDAGKALPLTTKVLMADGSTKTMEQLQPGDLLRDMEGNATSVIWKSPVMENHRLIRLSLSDSRSVVADEDHLWPVRNMSLVLAATQAHTRFKALPEGRFADTGELMDALLDIGSDSGLWIDRNHMVDSLAVAMRAQDREGYGTDSQDGTRCAELWLLDSGVTELLEIAVRRTSQMTALAHTVRDGEMVKLSSLEIDHLLTHYSTLELYTLERATENTVDGGVSLSDFYDGSCDLRTILGRGSVAEIEMMAQQLIQDIPDIKTGRKRVSPRWSDCLRLIRASGRCVDQTSGDIVSSVLVTQTDNVGAGDVACVAVDAPTATFVLADMTVTSNTTWMKQAAKQLANINDFCAFFNFKTIDPIQPWWSEQMEQHGGIYIPIDEERLSTNAGCMDPFNFYHRSAGQKSISSTITDTVLSLWDHSSMSNRLSDSDTRRTSLSAWVSDRVRNPLAQCTGDVIFGSARLDATDVDGRAIRRDREIAKEFLDAEEQIRDRGGSVTDVATEFSQIASEYNVVPPLPDREFRAMIDEAVSGSSYPFWTAFVSMDGFANRYIADSIGSGKPILFEWGENFTPPSQDRLQGGDDRMTPMEFDAVLSAQVALKYVRQAASNYQRETGHGGMIFIDEAAGPLSIPSYRTDTIQLLRELRAIGIRVVIGTQFLTDIPKEVNALSSVHIICAISKNSTPEEFQEFHRLTGASEADYSFQDRFITTAGRTDESDGEDAASVQTIRHAIPYAWVVDSVNNVNSPMLMGEFPVQELTGAMDDEEAEQLIADLEQTSYRDEETIQRIFSPHQ